eukprot:jgi/Pico_ML_1/53158/g3760.t1
MRDEEKGLLLAVSSSAFIGASFVVKKKGLRLAGSTGLRAVNAPEERMVQSVQELWSLAMQPEFLIYAFSTVATILFLIFYVAPLLGATNMLVYIGICSLMKIFLEIKVWA